MKNNRHSTLSLWEDINRALQQDLEINGGKYSSYKSTIYVGAYQLMQEVGKAIEKNDTRQAVDYLMRIAKVMRDTEAAFAKGYIRESEDYMKPYYELNLTADILIGKLENFG